MDKKRAFINYGISLVNNREAGFTLLEVMVAASILVLAIGGLYSLYVSPIRSLEYARESVLAGQQLRNTYKQLDCDLASVVLPSLLYPIEFIGSSNSISFFTASGLSESDDILSVHYQVLNESESSLVRNSVVLITGNHISFEFYDGVRKRWRSSWDNWSSTSLPYAVKLNFSLTSEQGVEYFSIISPVYVGRKMEKVVD